jgi:hypothetical protein
LADAGSSAARETIVRNGLRRATVPEYYAIKLKGHLDAYWSEWFAGLELTYLEGDETLLTGTLPDQAALHGLLELIRDRNLTLLSVNSGGPATPDSEKEE